MITWTKATLFMTGTCAAVLCCLAGCNKAPSEGGNANQAATAESSSPTASPLAAGLQEPPLAAPNLTDPASVATRQKYIEWVENKALPAGLHKPSLPDPNRTDAEATMARYKFALWGIAETKVAGDAAVKEQAKALGLDKPAPKGNYGHMAEGLPQPAGSK